MKLSFLLPLLCISCATPGGRTLIGALAGGVAGLCVQKATRTRNPTVVELMVMTGAGLGAGAGYYLEPKQTPSPESETKELTKFTAPFSPVPAPPTIVPPAVDSYFVDDQIKGTTFVPGHMEYKIKEPAKWTK